MIANAAWEEVRCIRCRLSGRRSITDSAQIGSLASSGKPADIKMEVQIVEAPTGPIALCLCGETD